MGGSTARGSIGILGMPAAVIDRLRKLCSEGLPSHAGGIIMRNSIRVDEQTINMTSASYH